MISLTTIPKAKLIAVGNLVLASACLVVIVVHYYRGLNSALPTSCIGCSGQDAFVPGNLETLGLFLDAVVLLPPCALLSVAAAAHWWAWSGRWVVQALAIGLLAVAIIVFLLLIS